MMGFIRDEYAMLYDIYWKGTTKINNITYRFKTIDLTDYDTMDKTCPCCSDYDNVKEMIKYCHCENYKEIICILEKV